MVRWTLVFSSTDLAEAELMRGLLIAHGIEALVIDRRPAALPQLAEVEVYVRPDEALRARHIVEKQRA